MGTAGNLSVRSGDLVAMTPSAVDYDELDPGLVCVVGVDGAIVGPRARRRASCRCTSPSTRHRRGAIVHTHAPYATTLATVVDELPAIHYMIAELGGPVRVAPYATSERRARRERETRSKGGARCCSSHGTLTIGDTLEQAYWRSVLLEWLAALYYRATLLGEPRLLPRRRDRARGRPAAGDPA